ncbi:MAG: hypothetical protein GY847_01700 [Proteobacteria bacterium]|nr:hypothetical protein [Pseudomonadota bacterium]
MGKYESSMALIRFAEEEISKVINEAIHQFGEMVLDYGLDASARVEQESEPEEGFFDLADKPFVLNLPIILTNEYARMTLAVLGHSNPKETAEFIGEVVKTINSSVLAVLRKEIRHKGERCFYDMNPAKDPPGMAVKFEYEEQEEDDLSPAEMAALHFAKPGQD